MSRINSIYYNFSLLFFLLIILVCFSCEPVSNGGPTLAEKEPIAKVYNKILYTKDIQDIIGEDISPEDSLLIINAYVDNWIKNTLVAVKAEQNIESKYNIDRLVQAYRNALIRHQYDKKLIKEKLDSNINQTEIQAYYNDNKENYLLDDTLVNYHYIKFPVDIPDLFQVRNWWRNPYKYKSELASYCEEHAINYQLDSTAWAPLKLLRSKMPPKAIQPWYLYPNREFILRHGEHRYFLLLKEIRKNGEIAPLSHVKAKLQKILFHKRKKNFLEKTYQDLFQEELSTGNVKIYKQ